MQFLFPGFLWALLALVIPVIIHLFNFRRYKTVYFSQVAFLYHVKKDTRSKSNLKNLLLLLARIFLIVFLVLAFARPYFSEDHLKQQTGIPHVAIYIDNSFSMEAEGKYGLLLEEAKMKSLQIADAYPYNAKFLLVTNSIAPSGQQWVSREQFVEKVSQVRLSHTFKTVNRVYDQIFTMLPSHDSSLNLHTFLLSDFQTATLEKTLVQFPEKSRNYALAFKNNNTRNLSIDSVWFETLGHYKGKKEVLHLLINNYSSESYNNIPIQLFINDSLKSSMVFSVEKESDVEVEMPFIQWYEGLNQVKAEINDYPITFDNTFYINYSINDKSRILIISGNGATKYIYTLFNEDENFEVRNVTANEIPYNDFVQYQLIVLNEIDKFHSGLISELNRFVVQGGTLVVITPADIQPEEMNPFLSSVSNFQLGNWINQQGTVSKLDEKNDLFQDAFKKSITESRLPVYQGFYPILIRSYSSYSKIFESESGSQIMVKTKTGEGICYLLTLPLKTENTDFGTHPIFVPLFYNLALQSSSTFKPYYWLQPNTMASISAPDYSGQTLVLKDGTSIPELMPGTRFQNGKLLVYPETDKMKAATYQALIDNLVVDNLSFNYDRNESVTTYFTENELIAHIKQLGLNHFEIMQPGAELLTKEFIDSHQGTDLTHWMLILALLFLLFEVFVIKLMR